MGVTALVTSAAVFACPVCERQEPKLLQGFTHAGSSQSNWDYLIISCAAVIVIATLFFSIKWLLIPGEKSETHIKHLILNNE